MSKIIIKSKKFNQFDKIISDHFCEIKDIDALYGTLGGPGNSKNGLVNVLNVLSLPDGDWAADFVGDSIIVWSNEGVLYQFGYQKQNDKIRLTMSSDFTPIITGGSVDTKIPIPMMKPVVCRNESEFKNTLGEVIYDICIDIIGYHTERFVGVIIESVDVPTFINVIERGWLLELISTAYNEITGAKIKLEIVDANISLVESDGKYSLDVPANVSANVRNVGEDVEEICRKSWDELIARFVSRDITQCNESKSQRECHSNFAQCIQDEESDTNSFDQDQKEECACDEIVSCNVSELDNPREESDNVEDTDQGNDSNANTMEEQTLSDQSEDNVDINLQNVAEVEQTNDCALSESVEYIVSNEESQIISSNEDSQQQLKPYKAVLQDSIYKEKFDKDFNCMLKQCNKEYLSQCNGKNKKWWQYKYDEYCEAIKKVCPNYIERYYEYNYGVKRLDRYDFCYDAHYKQDGRFYQALLESDIYDSAKEEKYTNQLYIDAIDAGKKHDHKKLNEILSKTSSSDVKKEIRSCFNKGLTRYEISSYREKVDACKDIWRTLSYCDDPQASTALIKQLWSYGSTIFVQAQIECGYKSKHHKKQLKMIYTIRNHDKKRKGKKSSKPNHSVIKQLSDEELQVLRENLRDKIQFLCSPSEIYLEFKHQSEEGKDVIHEICKEKYYFIDYHEWSDVNGNITRSNCRRRQTHQRYVVDHSETTEQNVYTDYNYIYKQKWIDRSKDFSRFGEHAGIVENAYQALIKAKSMQDDRIVSSILNKCPIKTVTNLEQLVSILLQVPKIARIVPFLLLIPGALANDGNFITNPITWLDVCIVILIICIPYSAYCLFRYVKHIWYAHCYSPLTAVQAGDIYELILPQNMLVLLVVFLAITAFPLFYITGWYLFVYRIFAIEIIALVALKCEFITLCLTDLAAKIAVVYIMVKTANGEVITKEGRNYTLHVDQIIYMLCKFGALAIIAVIVGWIIYLFIKYIIKYNAQRVANRKKHKLIVKNATYGQNVQNYINTAKETDQVVYIEGDIPKNYSSSKTSMIGNYLITGVVTTFQLFTTIAVGAGVAFFVNGMVIKCNSIMIQPGMYYEFSYDGIDHNFTLYNIEKVWLLDTSCTTAQVYLRMEKYSRCAGAVDWCTVDDCEFKKDTIFDNCKIEHTKIVDCFLQKKCTINRYIRKVIERETIYMARQFRYQYTYNYDGKNYTREINGVSDLHSKTLFAVVATTKDHADSIVINDQGYVLHSVNCYHQLINSPVEFVVVDSALYGDVYRLCNNNGCRQHNYVNSSNFITGKRCKIVGEEAECPITGDVVLTLEFSPSVKVNTVENIEYISAFTDEQMTVVSVCILFDVYYQNVVQINNFEVNHTGSYACHNINKTLVSHWIFIKSISDEAEIEIQNNDVYNITKYYSNVQAHEVIVDEEDLKQTIITVATVAGIIVIIAILVFVVCKIKACCYARRHAINIAQGRKTQRGGTCLLDCIISHPELEFSYTDCKGYIFIDVDNSHASIGQGNEPFLRVSMANLYEDAMLGANHKISYEQFLNKELRWCWAMLERGYVKDDLLDVEKFYNQYANTISACRCGEMMMYVNLQNRTFSMERCYQSDVLEQITGFKLIDSCDVEAAEEGLTFTARIITYNKGMVLEGLNMRCYGTLYMFEKGPIKSADCISVANIYQRKLCIPNCMFDACGSTACLIDPNHVKMWVPYEKQWQEWYDCSCDMDYYKINSEKEFKNWLCSDKSKQDDFARLYDDHKIKIQVSKNAGATFSKLKEWAARKYTKSGKSKSNKNQFKDANNIHYNNNGKYIQREMTYGILVNECEQYITMDGNHFLIPSWWVSVFDANKLHKYDANANFKYILPMSTNHYTKVMVDEKWALDREMAWYQSTFNLNDASMKQYIYYRDYVRMLKKSNKERAINILTLLGEQEDIYINEINFKKGVLTSKKVAGEFKQFDFCDRVYSGMYYKYTVKNQAFCHSKEVHKIKNKRIIAKDNPVSSELRKMSQEQKNRYLETLEKVNKRKEPTGLEYFKHTKKSNVTVWVDAQQNIIYTGTDTMINVDNYQYSFKLMSILKIWSFMEPPKTLEPNCSSFSFRTILQNLNNVIPMKRYAYNAKTISNLVAQTLSTLKYNHAVLEEFKRCCMFFRCSDVEIDINEVESIYEHETDEDVTRSNIVETNHLDDINSTLVAQELVNQNFQIVTKGHISNKCDLGSANCPAQYSEWNIGFIGPLTTDILKALYVIPDNDLFAAYEGQFYVPYCRMIKPGVTRLTEFDNNGQGMCVFNAFFHCDLHNEHVGSNAEHLAAYLYDTWGITTVIFGHNTLIIGEYNASKYIFIKREKSHISFLLPHNMHNYFRISDFIKPVGYNAPVQHPVDFEAQFRSFFNLIEEVPNPNDGNDENANGNVAPIDNVAVQNNIGHQNLAIVADQPGAGVQNHVAINHNVAAPEAADQAVQNLDESSNSSSTEDGQQNSDSDPENQRDGLLIDQNFSRYNIIKGEDYKLYRIIAGRRIEIVPGETIDYYATRKRDDNNHDIKMRCLTSDWPLHYFKKLCGGVEVWHGSRFEWPDNYYINATGNCMFICVNKISRVLTNNIDIIPIVDNCYTLGAFVLPVKLYQHIKRKITEWQDYCAGHQEVLADVQVIRRGRGEMRVIRDNAQNIPIVQNDQVNVVAPQVVEHSQSHTDSDDSSSDEDGAVGVERNQRGNDQNQDNQRHVRNNDNDDDSTSDQDDDRNDVLVERAIGERAFNMPEEVDQFLVDYFGLQPNADHQALQKFESDIGFTIENIRQFYEHLRPSLYSCDDFNNIFSMAIDYHIYTMKKLPFPSSHLIDYTTVGNYTGKLGITDSVQNIYSYCFGSYKSDFSYFAENKMNFVCEGVQFSGVMFGIGVQNVSLDIKPMWRGPVMLKAYKGKTVYIADFSNHIPQYSFIYKTVNKNPMNPNKRLNYFLNLQLDLLQVTEHLTPMYIKNCSTIIYNSYNYIVWDQFKLRDSIPNYNLTKWYYPTKLGLQNLSHYKVHVSNNRLKRNMFVRNYRYITELFYAEPSANSHWRDALAVYCGIAGINFRVGSFDQAEAIVDSQTLVYYGDCVYYNDFGKRVWDLFERYGNVPIQNDVLPRGYTNVNVHCDFGRIVQPRYVLNDVCYNCSQVYNLGVSGYFNILRRIPTVVDPAITNPRINNNPVGANVYAPRIGFSCNFSVGQPDGPFKYTHDVNTIIVLEGDNQWRYNFKNMLTFICSTFKAKITSAFAHNINFYVVDNTETAPRRFVVGIEQSWSKKLTMTLSLKSVLNEMTRTVLQSQTLNIGISEGMQLTYSRHVYLGLLLQQGYGYQTNRIGNIEQLFVDCGFRAEAVTIFCEATTADSYLHELASLFMALVKTWYVDRIITTLFVFFTKITATERALCQNLNGVLEFMNETKRLSYYELKLYGLIGQFMAARFGEMWTQVKKKLIKIIESAISLFKRYILYAGVSNDVIFCFGQYCEEKNLPIPTAAVIYTRLSKEDRKYLHEKIKSKEFNLYEKYILYTITCQEDTYYEHFRTYNFQSCGIKDWAMQQQLKDVKAVVTKNDKSEVFESLFNKLDPLVDHKDVKAQFKILASNEITNVYNSPLDVYTHASARLLQYGTTFDVVYTHVSMSSIPRFIGFKIDGQTKILGLGEEGFIVMTQTETLWTNNYHSNNLQNTKSYPPIASPGSKFTMYGCEIYEQDCSNFFAKFNSYLDFNLSEISRVLPYYNDKQIKLRYKISGSATAVSVEDFLNKFNFNKMTVSCNDIIETSAVTKLQKKFFEYRRDSLTLFEVLCRREFVAKFTSDIGDMERNEIYIRTTSKDDAYMVEYCGLYTDITPDVLRAILGGNVWCNRAESLNTNNIVFYTDRKCKCYNKWCKYDLPKNAYNIQGYTLNVPGVVYVNTFKKMGNWWNSSKFDLRKAVMHAPPGILCALNEDLSLYAVYLITDQNYIDITAQVLGKVGFIKRITAEVDPSDFILRSEKEFNNDELPRFEKADIYLSRGVCYTYDITPCELFLDDDGCIQCSNYNIHLNGLCEHLNDVKEHFDSNYAIVPIKQRPKIYVRGQVVVESPIWESRLDCIWEKGFLRRKDKMVFLYNTLKPYCGLCKPDANGYSCISPIYNICCFDTLVACVLRKDNKFLKEQKGISYFVNMMTYYIGGKNLDALLSYVTSILKHNGMVEYTPGDEFEIHSCVHTGSKISFKPLSVIYRCMRDPNFKRNMKTAKEFLYSYPERFEYLLDHWVGANTSDKIICAFNTLALHVPDMVITLRDLEVRHTYKPNWLLTYMSNWSDRNAKYPELEEKLPLRNDYVDIVLLLNDLPTLFNDYQEKYPKIKYNHTNYAIIGDLKAEMDKIEQLELNMSTTDKNCLFLVLYYIPIVQDGYISSTLSRSTSQNVNTMEVDKVIKTLLVDDLCMFDWYTKNTRISTTQLKKILEACGKAFCGILLDLLRQYNNIELPLVHYDIPNKVDELTKLLEDMVKKPISDPQHPCQTHAFDQKTTCIEFMSSNFAQEKLNVTCREVIEQTIEFEKQPSILERVVEKIKNVFDRRAVNDYDMIREDVPITSHKISNVVSDSMEDEIKDVDLLIKDSGDSTRNDSDPIIDYFAQYADALGGDDSTDSFENEEYDVKVDSNNRHGRGTSTDVRQQEAKIEVHPISPISNTGLIHNNNVESTPKNLVFPSMSSSNIPIQSDVNGSVNTNQDANVELFNQNKGYKLIQGGTTIIPQSQIQHECISLGENVVPAEDAQGAQLKRREKQYSFNPSMPQNIGVDVKDSSALTTSEPLVRNEIRKKTNSSQSTSSSEESSDSSSCSVDGAHAQDEDIAKKCGLKYTGECEEEDVYYTANSAQNYVAPNKAEDSKAGNGVNWAKYTLPNGQFDAERDPAPLNISKKTSPTMLEEIAGEQINIDYDLIFANVSNISKGKYHGQKTHYLFNMINSSEVEQTSNDVYIYELENTTNGLVMDIETTQFIVLGNVALPFTNILGGPFGVVNYDKNQAVLYFSTFNSVFSENYPKEKYNKIAYKVIDDFQKYKKHCINAICYGIFCEKWFGLLHSIKYKNDHSFVLNVKQQKAKAKYNELTKKIHGSILPIDMIYHPNIRASMNIEESIGEYQLPIVLYYKFKTYKMFRKLREVKKKNSQLFDEIITCISDYYDIESEDIHEIFLDGMRHFNIKVINKYDDELINKHTIFSNSSTWNHVPEENVIAVDRSLKVRLYTNTVVGTISENFKNILQNCVRLDEDLHIDALQVIVDNKKPKKLRNFLVGLLKGDQVVNDFSIMIKKDEVVLAKKKFCGRIICPPNNTLKTVAILLTTVLEEHLISLNHKGESSFCCGNSNEMNYKIWRGHVAKFAAPTTICIDGAAFDAKQFAELQDIIHNKIRILLETPAFENVQEFREAFEALFDKDHRLSYVSSNSRQDTNYPNIKLSVEGTSVSGHPLKTTYENTVKAEAYAKTILFEAGVHGEVMCCGDDTLVILDRSDVPNFLKAMPAVYNPFETLGQIAKALIINGKELDVSKIYLFDENNQFVRCDDQVLYDVVSQIPHNIVAEFCSCRFSLLGLVKNLNNMLLKNITYSNMPAKLVQESRTMAFSSWMCNPMVVDALRNLNNINKVRNKGLLEQDLFYNQVTKNKAIVVDDLCFEAHEVLLLTVLGEMQLDRDTILFRKMPQQLYTLVRTMFLRLNDIVFDMLLDLTNPQKFDIEELGEDKSLIYDYHLDPPQEGDFYNEVRTLKEQGQRILHPSVNYEFENEYGVIVFSNHGCQGLKVWKPKPEKKYRIQEFVETLRREIQEEFGKGASEECIPAQYVAPDDYDGSVIGDPTFIFEYPLATFDLANDFEEVELESFNKKIEYFSSDAEAQAKMRTFLDDTQAFRF